MIKLTVENVYIHQIANPPAPGRSIKANIDFRNLNHLEFSDWTNDAGPGHCSLKVTDAAKLSLDSIEQANIEKFIQTVLLACNMVLHRAAFSKHSFDASDTKIEFLDNNTHYSQTNDTSLRISESIHHGIEFHDNLDETKVLEIIKKIHSLDDLHRPVRFQINDIRKCLSEYTNAMSSFDRTGIFKHLFTSLELATNSDGDEKIGLGLDNKVARLAAISASCVKNWREFNDRAKHIDRNSQEERFYENHLQELGSQLDPLRYACQKIILDRL
jgi:hypothetical protein